MSIEEQIDKLAGALEFYAGNLRTETERIWKRLAEKQDIEPTYEHSGPTTREMVLDALRQIHKLRGSTEPTPQNENKEYYQIRFYRPKQHKAIYFKITAANSTQAVIKFITMQTNMTDITIAGPLDS